MLTLFNPLVFTILVFSVSLIIALKTIIQALDTNSDKEISDKYLYLKYSNILKKPHVASSIKNKIKTLKSIFFFIF
jgi:hypothetical protein